MLALGLGRKEWWGRRAKAEEWYMGAS